MLHLKSYITTAKSLEIDLTIGALFKVLDRKLKSIADRSVTASIMTDRLKHHLKAMGVYDGETSHSSRRGCAITLRMLGIKDEHINAHIGWNTRGMIDHYANIGNLCGPGGVASVLSEAANKDDCGEGSRLDRISEEVLSIRSLHPLVY